MNLSALLAAISIVESADKFHPQGNDLARGRKGEVSRYQIMPSTWRQYGGGPLANARHRFDSTMVAVRIIRFLHVPKNLSEEQQVMAVAIQWRTGPKLVRDLIKCLDRAHTRKNDYAHRVLREYRKILAKEKRK